VVDNLGDVTIEIAGQGTDTVNSGISWALGAELENLKLTGTAAINGTGNALRNSITGNDGNNILDGGAGADALAGGKGNDTYIVDLIQSGSGSTTTAALEDSITEAAGAGTDTLQLRGTVAGLAQAITLTLATDLENLDASATGTTRLNLTGNTANNIIIGNDADNRLNGGAGADTLRGGLGNDTYIVDSTSDRIEELSNQGIDTVNSGLSWTLGDHLENLTLTGTAAINGTGNSLDNQITGNSANNVLNGGLGADILIGGKGNDTYVVDNLGDIITELAGQGTDTVNSSLSWTLGAELENLKLTGTAAINGTGNALRNSITGNKGNNILDGRAGVDTLAGGLGDDTYIVDLIQSGSGSTATAALEDSITEAASAGIDTLQLRGVLAELAKVTTLTLATDLENLDASATGTTRLNITGNTANNIIIGNDADNRLNGGTGIDTLIGGKGNDTYVLDNANELNLVQELADEGTDTLQIAYSNTSTKVAQNIDLSSHQHLENVKITGTGLFNLTGNEANNVLTGNAANNRLDGGTGADTLIGGLGNDTYVVDNLNDVITELAGQGTDTVNSSLSWTLGAELENLVLTGAAHLDGTGNTLRNSLTGNDSNNILDGGAGADTLIGGRGNDLLIGNLGADILTGGEGADVFLFQTLSELGLGTKRDVINDFNASEGDLIDLSALDANGLLGGNNTFTFIGSASFTGLGQLRFQNQILYGNLSGDLQADFEIKLLGVSSLDASSLVV
jgi:serralysin